MKLYLVYSDYSDGYTYYGETILRVCQSEYEAKLAVSYYDENRDKYDEIGTIQESDISYKKININEHIEW